MRRLSISAAAVLLTSWAFGQAFGRFGYVECPRIPGFEIDRAGFRAHQPRADRLQFSAKAPQWTATEISSAGATYNLGGKNRSPSKLRINFLSPGFELYFANGFSFDVSSLQGPYLTWAEASIGPPNPTPVVPWVVISFSDAQPPVLVSFEGKSCAVRVAGKSGAWRIENVEAFQGWVRVALPQGIQPFATNDVSQLGTLAKAVKDYESFWNQTSPVLSGVSVKQDDQALTAVWSFDKPGAVVPMGALLSNLGGYSPVITSITRRVEAPTDEGPLSFCVDSKLVIRFPLREIPNGRSLTIGPAKSDAPPAVSPFDIPSLVGLALTNLTATGSDVAYSSADGILTDYLVGSKYEQEPVTGQKLPFEADGKGLDVAAAQALLAQALQLSRGVKSEPNAVLTSVLWLQDGLNWSLWCPDPTIGRRATALTAVACALSQDPSIRLQGAMLQAGLAAERGLGIWRLERRWDARPKPLIEPLQPLRSGLFFLDPDRDGEDPFVLSLLSPIRLFKGPGLEAKMDATSVNVTWQHRRNPAEPLIFYSKFPLRFTPVKNLGLLVPTVAGGATTLTYEPELRGTCELSIKIPPSVKVLPATVPVPGYSEPAH